MRYFYLLLLLLFLPGLLPWAEGQTGGGNRETAEVNRAAVDPFPAHVDTAITYFGIKEPDGENRGPDVKKFLAATGLDEGYPYCAAFISYCLDVAEMADVRRETGDVSSETGGVRRETPDGNRKRVKYPEVRSALAQDFIRDRSVDAKKVLRGQRDIPSGWIHVMKKGETRSGHTGFVLLPWSGRSGIVIDANTGTGLGGSERDGEGVWIRKRTIYTTCYFCIDSFTPVEYENE